LNDKFSFIVKISLYTRSVVYKHEPDFLSGLVKMFLAFIEFYSHLRHQKKLHDLFPVGYLVRTMQLFVSVYLTGEQIIEDNGKERAWKYYQYSSNYWGCVQSIGLAITL